MIKWNKWSNARIGQLGPVPELARHEANALNRYKIADHNRIVMVGWSGKLS